MFRAPTAQPLPLSRALGVPFGSSAQAPLSAQLEQLAHRLPQLSSDVLPTYWCRNQRVQQRSRDIVERSGRRYFAEVIVLEPCLTVNPRPKRQSKSIHGVPEELTLQLICTMA
jgi:hypothetical protein